MERNLCVTLVIYQESLHDERSTKCKVVAVFTRLSEKQFYVLNFSVSDISGVTNYVRLNLREKGFSSNRI